MELEPTPMDIEQNVYKAKDYVEEISKLVEHSEQHILQQNQFESNNIGEIEEINEETSEVETATSQELTNSPTN